MPSWAEFQPYIVTGLALGGLYALSGVGLVVLYRATGVLNLAFGAVGAMGAFIAYSIIQAGDPGWVAWITCIVFGGVVTLGYGMVFGPALAGRGPLVQSISTLGLALVLFGVIDLAWPTTGGQSPSISFPTDNGGFTVGQLQVNWTQVIALALGVAIFAPIGDLFESLIKRDLEVKDSGTVLAGHGGLLDRFDSLLLVLPVTYYLADYLHLVK